MKKYRIVIREGKTTLGAYELESLSSEEEAKEWGKRQAQECGVEHPYINVTMVETEEGEGAQEGSDKDD